MRVRTVARRVVSRPWPVPGPTRLRVQWVQASLPGLLRLWLFLAYRVQE
jgi:hypothetical protein